PAAWDDRLSRQRMIRFAASSRTDSGFRTNPFAAGAGRSGGLCGAGWGGARPRTTLTKGHLTAGWLTMNRTLIGALLLCACETAWGDGTVVFAGQKKRNNLVSELLEVAAVSRSGNSFAFTRPCEGWIFLAASYKGKGKLTILLDDAPGSAPVILHAADS